MRNLIALMLVASAVACGAPAYQPPSVRVAPAYGVTP